MEIYWATENEYADPVTIKAENLVEAVRLFVEAYGKEPESISVDDEVSDALTPTRDWYADVQAFHDKFGCHSQAKPRLVSEGVQRLRESLIEEEYKELQSGIDDGNLEQIADGAADLIYVVLGTCISYGIDLRPIWAEVQRTNMAKEGGITREDGKIQKPAGWQPPDIIGILASQAA